MWRFETILENFDNSNVWGGHVVVDDNIAQTIRKQKIKRLIATINDSVQIHCALLSKGDGTYYVMVNKTLQKKLNLIIGEKLNITLEKDSSKYGIPMPEEMAEILAQDSAVDELFHQLTPGKQRTLLYQIGLPKTSESRIKKAVLITRYLSLVNGNIDFREMNEYIKTNNKLF